MPAFVNSVASYPISITDQSGNAVDVSSYAFGMTWYKSGDCNPTVTLTEGSGLDVSDAENGNITITLTPAQTKLLGRGMARVILYKNYANETTRTALWEGSESIEGVSFDA